MTPTAASNTAATPSRNTKSRSPRTVYQVLSTLALGLTAMVKELQKQKKVEEAETVNLVNTKAIEPAYNFFGIKGEKVSERVPVVAGLLIFYVIYTMWYGYAIFDIFNGIGLSMSKSKAKKEA